MHPSFSHPFHPSFHRNDAFSFAISVILRPLFRLSSRSSPPNTYNTPAPPLSQQNASEHEQTSHERLNNLCTARRKETQRSFLILSYCVLWLLGAYHNWQEFVREKEVCAKFYRTDALWMMGSTKEHNIKMKARMQARATMGSPFFAMAKHSLPLFL